MFTHEQEESILAKWDETNAQLKRIADNFERAMFGSLKGKPEGNVTWSVESIEKLTNEPIVLKDGCSTQDVAENYAKAATHDPIFICSTDGKRYRFNKE